ncbi:hypothetical protein [Nocardioides zhouii]|uniref:Uncharacterized protein n=1 Tax=Nocardioides zhouii TaxID=1168729 RepID=A0A4Q2T7H7_9ACTN|nr:hypothetical protein [Nocardioides zhouii]RYC14742.1 hypothetical protein EUA94_01065 [Nocardioides zhouii]
MDRARAALAAGILIVLAAFAYGTEVSSSTTVDGVRADCGSAISASWLVSGTGDEAFDVVGSETRADERRHAACGAVVQRARTGVLATMAAGALLALVGWSSYQQPRERPRSPRPQVASDR